MYFRVALRCVTALVSTLLMSAPANALLFRAYVASDGNDANSCAIATPCRLLPAALAAVADGGEIWMLDSANYNTTTVTIGKSVTILAVPGAVGSVLSVGGPAISITAASLKISLRNLVIAPLPGGGGNGGVSMLGASSLVVEDCLIANHLPNNGLDASAGTLAVTRSTIRGNGRGVNAGNMNVSISDSKVIGNTYGLFAFGSGSGTTLSVSDSVASGNATGIIAFALASVVRVSVTRSSVDGSGVGLNSLSSGGTASITLSGSALTGNVKAWDISGASATIATMGNNHVADNASASTGALTPAGLQ
jgi:hypothetical protein